MPLAALQRGAGPLGISKYVYPGFGSCSLYNSVITYIRVLKSIASYQDRAQATAQNRRIYIRVSLCIRSRRLCVQKSSHGGCRRENPAVVHVRLLPALRCRRIRVANTRVLHATVLSARYTCTSITVPPQMQYPTINHTKSNTCQCTATNIAHKQHSPLHNNCTLYNHSTNHSTYQSARHTILKIKSSKHTICNVHTYYYKTQQSTNFQSHTIKTSTSNTQLQHHPTHNRNTMHTLSRLLHPTLNHSIIQHTTETLCIHYQDFYIQHSTTASSNTSHTTETLCIKTPTNNIQMVIVIIDISVLWLCFTYLFTHINYSIIYHKSLE